MDSSRAGLTYLNTNIAYFNYRNLEDLPEVSSPILAGSRSSVFDGFGQRFNESIQLNLYHQDQDNNSTSFDSAENQIYYPPQMVQNMDLDEMA